MHSRNGTLLNGRPIQQRQPLAENDRLDICDLAFVFYPGDPERYVASQAADQRDQVPKP